MNFSRPRIEKIRKEFNESRHKVSKSKVNVINKIKIENEKNLFATKIKEIEKNLLELEKNIMIMMILNIKKQETQKKNFDLSIDEDYYKPIITNGAFNNN